jgi:hypothetical protein
MAKQQLDGAQVRAGFEQVDGKGVAQRVRGDRLGEPARRRAFLQACCTAKVEID